MADQETIQIVELDQVSDCAQGYQGQEVIDARHLPGRCGLLGQPGANAHHQVKGDTDTGQLPTRKIIATQLGVDDQAVWGFLARQVVIGHQHPKSQRLCVSHTRHGGNAVVDGDDPVGSGVAGAF